MTAASHPSAEESGSTATLPDLLDRILDKGLVIAGDITIQLVDVDLITIKVRLLLASAERAEEMGIDWWKHDPFLSSQAQQDRHLDRRVDRLEELLNAVSSDSSEGQSAVQNQRPQGRNQSRQQQEASSHGGENERDHER